MVGQDGVRGLLCRGLGTRLMANVMQAALFSFLLFLFFIIFILTIIFLQAALFSVVWKSLEAELNRAS